MGADIHSFAEVRTNGKWNRIREPHFPGYGSAKTTEPFADRNYSVFGFLAGIRNYSNVIPLAEPRGLPADSEYLNGPSEHGNYERDQYYGYPIPAEDRGRVYTDVKYDANYHSYSWFTLAELLAFDYQQTFEDLRVSRAITNADGKVIGSHGGITGDPGEGQLTTYREFLGESFFQDIEVLKSLGQPEDVRIIFWFDN